MQYKFGGFTLVELVVVIVILGILAAVAIPKFINVTSEARTASINQAASAVSSSMALVHSRSVLDNHATRVNSEITLDGQIFNIVYGYPRQDQIATLAGLSDADFKNFNGLVTLRADPNCHFTYSPATATSSASLSAVTGC